MDAGLHIHKDTDRPLALKQRPWHAVEASDALEALGSSAQGLSNAEALVRMGEFGANVLEGRRTLPAWRVLLYQFRSPLIYVLLVAAAIAMAVGEGYDPYVILGVVILNALIGFAQERQAARALEALKRMTNPKVTVLRGGEPHRLDAAELVPGDVLLLEAGDRVGADARLLSASELQVDESALTGESEAASKHNRRIEATESLPLAERRNVVFMNTIVTVGKGRALVFATGKATQMGHIAVEISGETAETPLQRRLSRFSRQLGAAVLGVVFLVAAIALLKGGALGEVLLTALSMAVSGIPEGLPIVVTVLLAIGVSRMARRHALVRRLPAVEALGAATVIGSDKTGTLTRNQMTAKRIYLGGDWLEVSGEGYEPTGALTWQQRRVHASERPDLYWLAACAKLCNDALVREEGGVWRLVGDPTEGALFVLADKAGFDAPWERLEELPFSSERKWMATLHRTSDGANVTFVKGAIDRVESMACGWMDRQGRVQALDEQSLSGLDRAADQMAGDALRVMALGMVPSSEVRDGLLSPAILEGRVVMLGLVGLIDPPRPEAVEAIATCQRAGIRILMITGDHVTTATAIAERMGILQGAPSERSLTGVVMEGMDDDELRRRVADVDVFARVDPAHKLRIVRALQARGEIVAMTGDGVNDAPALHAADIGVAMGIFGSEVAKEAADMVLADDNFATIEAAVEEGRVIGDNLRKVLQYLLATSVGEVLTILFAILLGYPLPLAAAQILWVNLVTDGVLDKTLALEQGEKDLMERPPRSPRDPLFTRTMVYRLFFVAMVMAVGTVAVYAWDLRGGANLEHARTMAFTTLVMFQWFSAFTLRSFERPLSQLGPFSNRWMLLGLAVGASLHMAAIYWPPLAVAFHTVPLAMHDMLACLAVASTILLLHELSKWLILSRRAA